MSSIIWKDIDITLDKDQSGDIKTLVNEKSIEESIGNIFVTMEGSRRMVPNAFAPIWGILFEPMDTITANNLGGLLLKAIEDWEDRVEINNMHVHADVDNHCYEVKLSYTMVGSNEEMNVAYILRAK